MWMMTSKAARSQVACPRSAYEQVRRLRRQRRLDSVAPEVLRTQPWQPTFCGTLELQERALELLHDLA